MPLTEDPAVRQKLNREIRSDNKRPKYELKMAVKSQIEKWSQMFPAEAKYL